MCFSLHLVVIDQPYVQCVSVLEAEYNPPVAGYGHTPIAFQLAPQWVKAIARQIEVGRGMRLVEVKQNIPNPAHLVGANAARIVVLEQAF